MNKSIFDTNAYSNYIAGDLKIKKEIQKFDTVYIPLIVIGELYSGFYRGNKFNENNLKLKDLLTDKKVHILGLTKETARIYGDLLNKLQTKGTPISANDVWIAASAIETNSTLITYDKHFLKIPNLKLWNGIK